MTGQVAQMFEQALDPLKGWFDGHALDKTLKLSAALLDSVTEVPSGRVVHIDELTGEWALGATGTQMPCFLWAGKDQPDVYNSGVSPITGVQHWVGISPQGFMNALVATGGYELQSTEFNEQLDYLPNDLLGPDTDGILENGKVQYVDLIAAVASWGCQQDNQSPAVTGPVCKNAHQMTVITFWTYFLPGAVQGG